MSDLPDRLFTILSSEKFLTMQGLANEVPIFIQAYDVADEDRMSGQIKSLVQRLRNAGIKVADVDLFRLLLDELRDEDLLDCLIEDEQTFEKQDLFDTLKNHADPKSRLVPRLIRDMQSADVKLTLLTGIGHMFPLMRAHTLLDSIQPAMVQHPVILFFPGEYNQIAGLGSQLQLFGSMQSKGYYRAFNLDHYRFPSP
jgi:hypothetical protein